MIKCVIAFLFSVNLLNAQINASQMSTDVKVGDTFEIGKLETNKHKYIDFTRANFIIKRGGIANYKGAEGKKVVVASVKERKDGSLRIKIKRVDGNRFFGSHSVVAVDFFGALDSGELQTLLLIYDWWLVDDIHPVFQNCYLLNKVVAGWIFDPEDNSLM